MTPDATAPIATWAAFYAADLGWPVFPVRPMGKEPMTTHGFRQATTDPDVITAWWTTWPDANIGLPTGVAFDALDIDGPEGMTSLGQALDAAGAGTYRHTGPRATTGRGHHLLFVPTGHPSAAGIAPKVDWRGRGGYIVAAPSVHPSGRRYTWAASPSMGLPHAPAWLTRLLVAPVSPRLAHMASDYSQLRATRPDILAVALGMGLRVRRLGDKHVTNCIYHPDSTPSLVLYPDSTMHCFGCGAHGDSLDLQARTHI
jgi:hypothetical protein